MTTEDSTVTISKVRNTIVIKRVPDYMKVREVMKLLEASGWYYTHTTGDHRQYKHPAKQGRVTVAGHPGDDLHPKTLASIFRQAQIKSKK